MSELALGWATYNGDHMSMYGVNAGVPKTLIRYLVDYEAKRTNNDILKKTLQDILDTPVSPELLPPKDGKKYLKRPNILSVRMNFTISFCIILCVLVQSRQRY